MGVSLKVCPCNKLKWLLEYNSNNNSTGLLVNHSLLTNGLFRVWISPGSFKFKLEYKGTWSCDLWAGDFKMGSEDAHTNEL